MSEYNIARACENALTYGITIRPFGRYLQYQHHEQQLPRAIYRLAIKLFAYSPDVVQKEIILSSIYSDPDKIPLGTNGILREYVSKLRGVLTRINAPVVIKSKSGFGFYLMGNNRRYSNDALTDDGVIQFDKTNGTLMYNGIVRDLTPAQSNVFSILLKRGARVAPYYELISALNVSDQSDYPPQDYLRVVISRLRRKIKECDAPFEIKNERGHGFSLQALENPSVVFASNRLDFRSCPR